MKTSFAAVLLSLFVAAFADAQAGRFGYIDDFFRELVKRTPKTDVSRVAILFQAQKDLARKIPLFDDAGREVVLRTEAETSAFTAIISEIGKRGPKVSIPDVWDVLDRFGATGVVIEYDKSTCRASITTTEGLFKGARKTWDWCAVQKASELPTVIDRLIGR